MSKDEVPVLPMSRSHLTDKVTVCIGESVSTQEYVIRRGLSADFGDTTRVDLSADGTPTPFVGISTAEELRAIDPEEIVEILLMPTFKDLPEYEELCTELSKINGLYDKLPIRSGEAMGA